MTINGVREESLKLEKPVGSLWEGRATCPTLKMGMGRRWAQGKDTSFCSGRLEINLLLY